MKTKLYLGLFILLFAFMRTHLGHVDAPNQQILVQFSDKNVSIDDTKATIWRIQDKLKSIGAENIKIVHNGNGQLKITYHSNTDVNSIQSILSEEKGFELAFGKDEKNFPDFPNENDQKDYELNITEIQNGGNADWDFEGTQVVQWNQKSDRFNYHRINTSATKNTLRQSNTSVGIAVKANNTIALVIDNIFSKIPEVRAGPIA